MKKEIEVKAYLKDREKVLNSLIELGTILGEVIHQDGTEYAKIGNTLEEYLSNSHFVRVRTENGVHKFTVKDPSRKFSLSKIEHETKIDNREAVENALLLMGYLPVLRINKKRQIAKYKDYEICIDEVDELGSFIEIEKMSEEDPGIVLKELQDLLFSLGVLPEHEVQKGYDILMFEKMGK
jgi:adenylate cyclase class 2